MTSGRAEPSEGRLGGSRGRAARARGGWLSAPALSDREEQRVASTLYVVAWASLVGGCAWAPLSWLLFPGEWLRSSVVPVVIGVSAAALALARRGRVRAASWAMITMVWGVFTYVLVVARGVVVPARSGYLVLVVMSGLLLGARGALLSSVASVATLGVLAPLETRHEIVGAIGLREDGRAGLERAVGG